MLILYPSQEPSISGLNVKGKPMHCYYNLKYTNCIRIKDSYAQKYIMQRQQWQNSDCNEMMTLMMVSTNITLG